MTEVKVLVKGYARKEGNKWYASPSTILIKSKGLKLLVDPGSNKKLLLSSLEQEKLKPKDIDAVFLTHYHLDHLLNIRLFPNKKVYDGNTINIDDEIIEYSGNIPETNVKVLHTPGHSQEHSSLVIETDEGTFAVAGDVFWWRDDEEQKTDRESLLEHKDTLAEDEEELIRSRKKLLEVADYVIPGHGEVFKVKK